MINEMGIVPVIGVVGVTRISSWLDFCGECLVQVYVLKLVPI